jgi:hypothetical protein
LEGPHLVDDALENTLDRVGWERTLVVGEDVMKDLVFSFGFVNAHVEMVLDAADVFDYGGALV